MACSSAFLVRGAGPGAVIITDPPGPHYWARRRGGNPFWLLAPTERAAG
jgi:hypothetical protein